MSRLKRSCFGWFKMAFILIYPILVCNALTLANLDGYYDKIEKMFYGICYVAGFALVMSLLALLQLLGILFGRTKPIQKEMLGKEFELLFPKAGVQINRTAVYRVRFWKLWLHQPELISLEEITC